MGPEEYVQELEIAADADDEGRHDDAARIRRNAAPDIAEPDRSVAQVRVNASRMSAEMRRRIAMGARAELARRSFAHFVRQAWQVLEPETPLEWNWHHQLVCDVIQGLLMDWLAKQRNPYVKQRYRNAIFNLPPGAAKSRLISVFAMPWMWLHRPSWSVFCLSANPDVAVRDATFARDIVESEWYRTTFGITWTIREDVDAKGKYRNTMGGERTSRGFTSKVVGNRADAILIDDPNDMHEVFSEASRREVNGKWDNAIYNRVNDARASLRLLVQQRGHEEDLTGHWLARAPEHDVLRVSLPVEFDLEQRAVTPWGSDPRTRDGEILHASRYTPDVLAAERTRLGTFGFEAQYNQRPRVLDGGMIKRSWWRFFRPPGHEPVILERPPGCDATVLPLILEQKLAKDTAHWTERIVLDWMLISVDASFGTKDEKTSSAVGLLVIGGRAAQRYVFEDRTALRSFPETLDAIRSLIKDYPAAKKYLVEKRANGDAVIQVLGREVSGLVAIEPMGKMVGAQAMSPSIEAGNVFLLEGAAWLRNFVDELGLFPKGTRDDRVDALAQALAYAEKTLSVQARWAALAK